MAAIFFDNFYSNAVDDGITRTVAQVIERPGMADAIIAKVNDADMRKTPYKVGTVVYLKTKLYDVSGSVFYLLDQKIPGQYNVYIKSPFKGNDLSGGVISTKPIVSGVSSAASKAESPSVNVSDVSGKEKTAPAQELSMMASLFKNKKFLMIAGIILGVLILSSLLKSGKKHG